MQYLKEKIKLNKALYLVLLVVISLSLITILLNNPKSFGDGSEYTLLLESLYNHQSPELRLEDINSTYTNALKYNYDVNLFTQENAYSGYFTSGDGLNYSYHFWGYSLVSLPVRGFLEVFNLNIFNTFAITNLLLFSITSFLIPLLIKRNKIISFLILTLNTSILYINLNHPEFFTYSLVLLSSLLFLRNKYFLAILLSSLASLQNTPVIFLTLLILIYSTYIYFKETGFRLVLIKRLLPIFLISLISVIPFIFYYINFQTFNLIQKVGGSDLNLISLKRVIELFFDPNLGLFFYVPLSVIGIVTSIYYFIKKRSLKILILILSVVLMSILSTSTTNWNHGMITSSRYAIWAILPIGNLLLIEIVNRENIIINLKDFIKLEGLKTLFKFKYLITIAIYLLLIYQLLIVVIAGGLISNGRLGGSGLTPFSQVILNYFPSLYSPTQQIFEGRVLCNEKLCDYPIIYKYNNDCKKILLKNTSDNVSKVINECGENFNIDHCDSTFCYYSY